MQHYIYILVMMYIAIEVASYFKSSKLKSVAL